MSNRIKLQKAQAITLVQEMLRNIDSIHAERFVPQNYTESAMRSLSQLEKELLRTMRIGSNQWITRI